jgi:hypothetical protein
MAGGAQPSVDIMLIIVGAPLSVVEIYRFLKALDSAPGMPLSSNG